MKTKFLVHQTCLKFMDVSRVKMMTLILLHVVSQDGNYMMYSRLSLIWMGP